MDDTSWWATSGSNTAVVIDAKGVNTIFRFDVSETRGNTRGTSFRNITFVNGFARQKGDETGTYTDTYPRGGGGGALGNNSYGAARATVSNCVFRSNYAAAQGGALMMCNVYDCYFTNNVSGSALGGAGVTGVEGFPPPRVTGCVFVGNMATLGGGVSRADVSNCLFVANCATNGGGVYQCPRVADCLFVSNTASYGGGAFACSNLTDCTFQDCAAWSDGGCAYDSSLFGCLVTNCTVLRGGDFVGGVSATTADGWLAQGTTFVDCRSAMNTNVWWATRRLRQVDCTFIRCGASENTAAVRCTFTGVAGEGFPSSILVKGVATNCLMAGCQAKYLLEWMDEVVNCTVVSNNLGTTGQLFAGPIRAVNCIFRDNYHYDPKTSPALHYDIAGYGQWTLENCLYKTFPD